MAASGVELRDDPETGEVVAELNVSFGVVLQGDVAPMIAWLRDVGLDDLALTVADAHYEFVVGMSASTLAEQWLTGGAA